ncbi:MAG: class I SAM-dependent methyltransferase [Gammaproteobacteria bacterium]|nr:class I SAM-dependent methyltransferase [Gammaproteobacteria bacterium]
MAQRLESLYRPTHDEAARHGFVGALKRHVNGPMEHTLSAHYDALLASGGGVEQSGVRLQDERLFRLWASVLYTSQDLMWESLGETVDRLNPLYVERWRDLAGRREKLGSLQLDPSLTIPEPIASCEMHRQPGGYCHAADQDNLTAPLAYFSAADLYLSAKGFGLGQAAGTPAMCHLILAAARRKRPGLAPTCVLDMGCGPGTETIGYRMAFPNAEMHGVDLAAPFLKFAHLWAEHQGQAIHYRHANAADTRYPAGKFDLIVSHILFHETSGEMLPQILREAHRLLAPGGVLLNADVPYQTLTQSVPKRITNAWQVDHNGEPFWIGFADTDVRQALIEAGFEPEEVFAEYVPLGSGRYFIFGAAKKDG